MNLEIWQRVRAWLAAWSDPQYVSDLWGGVGRSLLATLLMVSVIWCVWRLRRWGVARLSRNMQGGGARRAGWLSGYLEAAGAAGRLVATALAWLLTLLALEAWGAYVLHQFPYTRPWGEKSSRWLLGAVEDFALGIAGAVPGLLVAGFIFLLARIAARGNGALLSRIERGEVHVPWLDADTVEPTRRLASLLIWLFALAMAYPYLPGSHSEAFKGVTVLAGLMLSLGASSVVGQALSGMSLMYSRAVRTGEYVKVGETEGTVMALGLFATRIHTGTGEEVSLPNSVMFGQPIRNFSRLVRNGRFLMHTSVTIGYGTPWRQVHALLLEAARRTPAVAAEPAPCVVQTALSDFYVEYRLCAEGGLGAPQGRAAAMSQLHANVQDVFSENGVQIMSPHYVADAPEPQVVPPGPWASARSSQPLKPL